MENKKLSLIEKDTKDKEQNNNSKKKEISFE